MPDRTRPIRKEICLNAQELNLIQHKMRQLGTHNFGAYARKSRECSPKIRDFRANGIPVQDRVVFFDTIIYTLISFDNAKE